jgi:hypothetical protein
MDHFQATRTDIPFLSFSEAVRAGSEKASALNGTADYLDVEPYQKLLQDLLFCVGLARGLERSVRQRKEEYDQLMLEVGRNISAPDPVRQGIQGRLRKLAYNPLEELCSQESIARSVAQLTDAHKSLKDILDTKHPISALRTINQKGCQPEAGETASYDEMRGD